MAARFRTFCISPPDLDPCPQLYSKPQPGSLFRLEWRRHFFGATWMSTIAGEFRQFSGIVAICAAVLFIYGVTVARRMRAFVALSHCLLLSQFEQNRRNSLSVGPIPREASHPP